MNLEDFKITSGINSHQNASIERNEKTIDYSSSKPLSYADILSITKGLNVISEFFDVNAVVTVSGTNISAVALGKSLEEAIVQAMDSNPLDFVNANVVVSAEIDSDAAKMLKGVNIIIAPKFTKNAVEYLDSHDICYVSIETPLKDYKKYLSNETIVTPLGTLVQTPNLSELDKETFIRFHIPPKEMTVEQIEDAVFAWKVAKHAKSQAVVIAKDLKTSAVAQGLRSDASEYALNAACERAKDAVLASDIPLDVHDINAAIQCRIALVIVPSASSKVVETVDKYGLALITTGITNKLF